MNSSPAPHVLQVDLLGKVDVRLGGSLKFPYVKVLALFAYLLLEPGRQARERLTGLFWPQQDPATARTNLRNAVHALRRLIGESRIGSDRGYVWFTPQALDELDIARLSQPDSATQLLELVNRYSGELMAGHSLLDAPDYMEWLDIQRLAFHRQVLALSEQLYLGFTGDTEQSRRIALAQTQTRLDPWCEEFHLRLIQLLAEEGRQAAALAHYGFVRELFQRELDTLPGPAMRNLVGRLRSVEAESAQLSGQVSAPLDAPDKTRPVALLYIEIGSLPPHDANTLAVLRRARQLATDEAMRLGAHVCATLDGHVLAYFGYPEGLPNACQRALRVALHLCGHPELTDILLRQSLHQGPMLISPDPRFPDALGMLSNLVIKLADSARPGDILATEVFTRRLNPLDLSPLERAPALYLHNQINAYRINPIQPVARREAPMVGQTSQRAALRNLWRGVRRGKLRAALLGGPPGCGKSRLARWMVGTLDDPSRAIVIECRQASVDAPFAPLVEVIKRQCGIHSGDALPTRTSKLARWLNRSHPHLTAEQRQMIEWLAGLPLADEELSPTARRRLLRDAVLAMLTHLCGNGPFLVVVEDLHWADPSTLELIEACLARAAHLSWMLLVTTRKPMADEWQPQLPRINPAALSPDESRRLIQALSNESRTAESIARLVAEAGGNPLFIEALVQTQTYTKTHTQTQTHSLQESVHDWLAGGGVANDELPRRIGQGAAALGEVFEIDWLRALFSEEEDDRFYVALRVLERHGVVHRPEAGLGRFHHALIRDALYDSLPSDERRRLHGRIQMLAAGGLPSAAERSPGWLARHAASAGDLAGAADLFERAAHQALGLAAYTEAVRHFQAARALVDRLPASLENDRHAMRLLLGEGNTTVALRGYGAEETRALFSQVLARSGDMNADRNAGRHAGGHDEEERFLAHYGLWLGGSSHGGYREALRYVDRLQRIAEVTQDPVHQLQTAYAYGNTYLWLGELGDARRYLETAVALYEQHRPADLLACYSEDTGVTSLSLLSWVIWLQGDATAAQQVQQRALALSEQLEHPYSRCFALTCAGRLGVIAGDIDAVCSAVEQLLAVSSRHDFAIWQAVGTMLQAWARCAKGDAGGIELAERSLALINAALPALEVTHLSMYVDALYRLGRLQPCAQMLDVTLARCAYWQDRYMEPELLRLRGFCAVAVGDTPAEAAGYLLAARELAIQQGALGLLQRIDVARN